MCNYLICLGKGYKTNFTRSVIFPVFIVIIIFVIIFDVIVFIVAIIIIIIIIIDFATTTIIIIITIFIILLISLMLFFISECLQYWLHFEPHLLSLLGIICSSGDESSLQAYYLPCVCIPTLPGVISSGNPRLNQYPSIQSAYNWISILSEIYITVWIKDHKKNSVMGLTKAPFVHFPATEVYYIQNFMSDSSNHFCLWQKGHRRWAVKYEHNVKCRQPILW